ncbi:ligand-binding SRPBCC domain-containing protein [Haloferula luteola]|uniref:Ligand-binding SRPBCC domain-containing protein n=1 Tax=Haloferula luteola TaxID=595692 RepID=A0A840UZT2_9BACT|nr:SRPBCC family protein [Haloferula luteola]MBB5350513.1 ligand-binding SRPBCC domain-containing protein [Haloferula luteola]
MQKIHLLEQSQDLALSLDEAWSFFSSPRNLDEITPTELGFRIESCLSDVMHEGQIITYKVMIFPGIWVPWVTEIRAVQERCSFIDEQRFGPYAFWHHRHHFEAMEGGVRMLDQVHYAVPFWPLGELAHETVVRPKLERIFEYRRKVLAQRFGEVGPQSR